MAGSMDISNMKAVVGEFQRNYLYYVQINSIPPALKGTAYQDAGGVNYPAPGTTNTKFGDYTGFQGAILEVDLFNKKAFFPKRKVADISQSWAGQTFHVSGVDESDKSGTLEFNQDQQDKIYRFFMACQSLTGDEKSHSAYDEVYQNLDLSIIRVDVSKTKQTVRYDIHRVKVLGVEQSDPDKAATDLGSVTVNVVWDWGEYVRVDKDTPIGALPTTSTLPGSEVSGEPYNVTAPGAGA